MMNDENIVSVILRDTSGLVQGDSYRFCLVLLQEKNIKRDLVVGCSNITKLQAIEETLSDTNQMQLQKLITNTRNSHRLYEEQSSIDSDISSFDRISDQSDELTNPKYFESSGGSIVGIAEQPSRIDYVAPKAPIHHQSIGKLPKDPTLDLFSSINRSFLPGLGLGILVTSLFVLIWGATKLRSNRQNNPNVSTCYAASATQITNHQHDHENRNRYLKLQATTSL